MKKIIFSGVLLTASCIYAFDFGSALKAVSTASSNTVSKQATTKPTQNSALITTLTQQLNISDRQAQGGVGSILSYAKSSLTPKKYDTLAKAIPHSNSLLNLAPQATSMLGGLGGKTSSIGSMASLASQFSSLGLSTDMIGKFIPIITNYLKGSGSTDAMGILSTLFKG